jgi:hypothetical protein
LFSTAKREKKGKSEFVIEEEKKEEKKAILFEDWTLIFPFPFAFSSLHFPTEKGEKHRVNHVNNGNNKIAQLLGVLMLTCCFIFD